VTVRPGSVYLVRVEVLGLRRPAAAAEHPARTDESRSRRDDARMTTSPDFPTAGERALALLAQAQTFPLFSAERTTLTAEAAVLATLDQAEAARQLAEQLDSSEASVGSLADSLRDVQDAIGGLTREARVARELTGPAS
jgi:hypothetical protein